LHFARHLQAYWSCSGDEKWQQRITFKGCAIIGLLRVYAIDVEPIVKEPVGEVKVVKYREGLAGSIDCPQSKGMCRGESNLDDCILKQILKNKLAHERAEKKDPNYGRKCEGCGLTEAQLSAKKSGCKFSAMWEMQRCTLLQPKMPEGRLEDS